MANVFTGLLPIIYLAMDQVARELTGFIPSVYRNSAAERVGKDQTIRYSISAPVVGEDITPGRNPADSGDTTHEYADMAITKSRAFPVRITGEDYKTLDTQPGLYDTIMQDRFAQAIRAAVNEIETDIGMLYKKASRAYGTAGSTPFAASIADIAAVRKILKDNGTPDGDITLVVDTSAGLNMRSLTQYVQLAEARGTLEDGLLLKLQGMTVRESAQIAAHTKGAGTGYDYVTAGEAVGQTTLSLEGGTVNTTGIKAGDIITQAGDTNKYVVKTGLVATSGDIVIAKPGLRVAGADATELTIGNSYAANMAFHRSAIHLVTRMPAAPKEGDSAIDSTIISDPITGLNFELRAYAEYRRIKFEVGIAWGTDVVKPEFTALLLG